MKREFKIGDKVMTNPVVCDSSIISGEGIIVEIESDVPYPYYVKFENDTQPFKEDELTLIEEEEKIMKIRGFEPVKDAIEGEYFLPVRADKRSAGYDFSSTIDVEIQPHSQVLIWTNIKSYMLEDEVLKLYVRSSIGIKKHLTLANVVGIIDSSYYSNPSNDGNIGICLRNDTDNVVSIEKGERIAQGVFVKYLVADEDNCLKETRDGGIGSSNK
ncbi:MAG: hypothetical protein ACRCTZ_17040 [Sarcina sp.]